MAHPANKTLDEAHVNEHTIRIVSTVDGTPAWAYVWRNIVPVHLLRFINDRAVIFPDGMPTYVLTDFGYRSNTADFRRVPYWVISAQPRTLSASGDSDDLSDPDCGTPAPWRLHGCYTFDGMAELEADYNDYEAALARIRELEQDAIRYVSKTATDRGKAIATWLHSAAVGRPVGTLEPQYLAHFPEWAAERSEFDPAKNAVDLSNYLVDIANGIASSASGSNGAAIDTWRVIEVADKWADDEADEADED